MNKTFLIVSIIFIIGACTLITESNISDSEVYVISPPDGLVTTSSTHTFWWEYVSDAEFYTILIVSPTWDSVVRLVADTNVTGNKLTVSLPPGKYNWGVSAQNHSSQTPYTISQLTIDTSNNLNGQFVILKDPADYFNTQKQDITFNWFKIDGATTYLFDIRYNSWLGDNVIPTQSVDDLTFGLTLKEGVYSWGVKAINDFSWTQHTVRIFTIDQTPPGKANITFPAYNGDTLNSDNLYLEWSRPDTSLSPISDSVFISSDSTFTPGNYQYYITRDLSISLEGFEKGVFFARVRSFDAAGNVGTYSTVRKFYIYEE